MREGKIARGIINNLNAAPDTISGIAESKYFLSRLRMYTGETQQAIIGKCVAFAVRNIPEYSVHFDKISNDWKLHNSKEEEEV